MRKSIKESLPTGNQNTINFSSNENPYIKKLIVRAIVRSILGDKQSCKTYGEMAAAERKKDELRNRLHATVEEILRAKGQEVRIN